MNNVTQNKLELAC